MVYEHHERMLMSENVRVKSILFEMTTSITNICDSISESKEINGLLRARYDTRESAEEALQEISVLNDYFVRHTETSSITLLTDHPELFSYEGIRVVEESEIDYYKEQWNNPGYHWNIVYKTNHLGVDYIELELTHPINIIQSPYDAILKISVSGNYLNNRIDNNNLDVDLVVNDQPVFYSTWGNIGKTIEFQDFIQKPFFTYSGVDPYIEGSGLLEVSAIQPIKSQDSIYVFSSDAQAIERVENIQLWTILIIFLSLVIPTAVIIKYTKELTNRVDTLRTEMHRVTGGDYHIIETFKGNDELVDLFKDLKVMIRSIEERDKKIFDGRLKEQELISHQKTMEMEILSSKINPHFLYNTLETIRMKAINMNDHEVARAVKLVGQYMRYNLESTGGLTLLKDELKFINLYIDIQSLRFQNRISASIEIETSLQDEEIWILPLLIQPIVENAYIHGHKETLSRGTIQVRVTSTVDKVNVSVEDNGSGIETSVLNSIIKKIELPNHSTSSIGLHNIHQRLKLYYGAEYGLTIDTEQDKGTRISFTIPYKNHPKD
jgi:two-component system, sensor histidine kinase YesM